MTQSIINEPRFAHAANLFALACAASRYHSMMAQNALRAYGSHGPDISGCVRSHFPDHIKDDLRSYARRVTEYSEAGYAARPPRVRRATMVRLARLIATRDGSGFYGPQPYTTE